MYVGEVKDRIGRDNDGVLAVGDASVFFLILSERRDWDSARSRERKERCCSVPLRFFLKVKYRDESAVLGVWIVARVCTDVLDRG